MKKIILFTILFLFVATLSYADDISISSNVDRNEIALDEQITLTITVAGNVSNIPKPQIPDLNGFSSYSAGRSQNVSIINGQISSSVVFTYILVPNDVGEYKLGPFTIDYKGSSYSAGPIDVSVISKAAGKAQTPSYTYSDEDESYEQETRKEVKELFIETYVDKLTAYVNEQITLTFAFYQAVNLFENPAYNPPSVTGFWAEDMPPQKKFYKIINDKKYLVTEIKTALFATSQGEFTIGAAKLEASVEDLERFSSRSPFDVFNRDPFSMFRRGKPIILTTDPITVNVLPLPEEGKSLNFKGDVGSFDIAVSLDKDTVEENQPITLKIKIEGKGNIKTTSSPELPDISDVRFYDSGSSENISKENYIVQGEKIFEKVVIPKKEGTFAIGPIEYSYFDPVSKRYIEKNIPPITINATKSEESSIAETPFSAMRLTKEEVKLLKKDICYIKTSTPHLKSKEAFLYKNKLFWLINIFILFILSYLYVYHAYKERLRTDIGYARSRKARSIASKRLKRSRNIALKGNVKDFYAEIYRAVIEYIADRLNIPHPSITKDILERSLEAKSASKKSIEELKELFDLCDMARFASGNFTKEDMRKTLEEATRVIEGLERVL